MNAADTYSMNDLERLFARGAKILSTVMLRRKKSDVLTDLPAKRHETVEVEIAPAALLALESFAKKLAARGFTIVDNRILRRDGTEASLDDLTSDKIVFAEVSKMRAAVASAKIPALLEMVADYEEAGEPLVVFSAHVEPATTVAARPGWALIDGSVPAHKRTEAVAAFQAGKLKGIACTRAGAEGITLTRASNMIFVDLFWSPGVNAQAQDRIHRIGQKEACLYRTLVANHPIDALVHGLLQDKADRQAASVDAASVKTGAVAATAANPFAAVLALPDAPLPAQPAPRAVEPAAGPAPTTGKRAPLEAKDMPYGALLTLAAKFQGLERGEPRAAVTAQEIWASSAVQTLTGACDGAFAEDGMGFSKADTTVGRYLGHFIAGGGLLDEVEWAGVVSICRRYPKQVGSCPAGTEDDKMKAKELRERAKKVTEMERSKPAITISQDGVNLLVDAPYSEGAARAWRNIPGRRWDSAQKLNIVPVAQRAALDAVLAEHFPGKLVADPDGLYISGARNG